MLRAVSKNSMRSLANHHSEIVGNSPALRRTLDRIETVAPTDAAVLILGESGVGKELISRSIHSQSSRADRPLVVVNCAAIPDCLFESEFFGHVRGAFTGACSDRTGRFDLANGGSLFLDEIAEIPLALQGKLLRVLQDGEFERVGGGQTRSADVRIIAATNRNLYDEVAAGRFREDLYYRLSVFPVDVPSLRERIEDIDLLARHFLQIACETFGRQRLQLSQAHSNLLCTHDWPGNVRELRNVIERAAILSQDGQLNLQAAMPRPSPRSGTNRTLARVSTGGFVDDVEWQRLYRCNLVAALNEANWRIAGDGGAADLLGLRPSTLRDRMKSMAIFHPRQVACESDVRH